MSPSKLLQYLLPEAEDVIMWIEAHFPTYLATPCHLTTQHNYFGCASPNVELASSQLSISDIRLRNTRVEREWRSINLCDVYANLSIAFVGRINDKLGMGRVDWILPTLLMWLITGRRRCDRFAFDPTCNADSLCDNKQIVLI